MTDIIYILGRGSRNGNRELFYSMRSVMLFLRNVGNVYIVGAEPKMPSDPGLLYTWLPVDDLTDWPAANINHCLAEACRHPKISDTFLRVDDDCFFLQGQDADAIPDFQRGLLADHLARRRPVGDMYGKSLQVTVDYLRAAGLPSVDFEVHGPMLFNKQSLGAVLDCLDPHVGYLSRSIYANTQLLTGRPLKDCKLNAPMPASEIREATAGRPFFSVGDGGLTHALWNFLDRTFTGQCVTG